MRSLADDEPFRLERCANCRFDLRSVQVQPAPEHLIQSQISHENLMRTQGQGTEVIEFFAVLRHIVSLIFGENRGLEEFRRIVARLSATKRVDTPIPYEPDAELLAFEEADVVTRSHVLGAANWLMRDWPVRFVECCREAEVKYPALNRPYSIKVRWYCDIATRASAEG